MSRQQAGGGNLRGGKGYSTELAGRDRFRFFRRPVEGEGGPPATAVQPMQYQFASSCPPGGVGGGGGGLADDDGRPHSSDRWMDGPTRPHHLPSLETETTRNANKRNNKGKNTNPNHNGGTRTAKRARAGPGSAGAAGGVGGNLSKERAFAATYSGADALEKEYNEGGQQQPRQHTTAVQTLFRENEVQTDPYSPDYYIPDGAPEPEILKLQHLHYGQGLPAGREEVELIQRLRRRQEVEAAVPQGNDPASIEARYKMLHELEEEEWRERETHVARLQERRLGKIQASLEAREAAREEANKERLERLRDTQTAALRQRLQTLQGKRSAVNRQAMDKKLQTTYGAANRPVLATATSEGSTLRAQPSHTQRQRPDLIDSYVKYGTEAQPPQQFGATFTTSAAPQATMMQSQRPRAAAAGYDVRPALLTVPEGVAEVEAARGGRIEAVRESAFAVPEQAAVQALPTLHQRHEAERLLQSLAYAQSRIDADHSTHPNSRTLNVDSTDAHEADHSAPADKAASRKAVLDRYRATPKVVRPDTPELELDGDDEEGEEEAAVLLQRLLRGRAVQNDLFEGKERCRGLIEELQAASNATYASRSLSHARDREAVAAQQEALVQTVLEAAEGDIIAETLTFLLGELDRQREQVGLLAARDAADAVRAAREAEELQRREAARRQREREGVAHRAFVNATNITISSFLQDLVQGCLSDAALAEAVAEERERQARLPPLQHPTDAPGQQQLACDLLDQFVIGAVVDMNKLRGQEREKQAPAAVAMEAAGLEAPPPARLFH